VQRAWNSFAFAIADLASRAGRILVEHRSAPHAVHYKEDGSPVTDADVRSQEFIVGQLRRIAPGVPVLAEEGFDVQAASGDLLLFVDPIDGTKQYLANRNDFTINIALVERRSPLIGCVYAPARQRLYVASTVAYLAIVRPGERVDRSELAEIHARSAPHRGMSALVSRSHLDARTRAFLDTLHVARRRRLGSSLKFCVIAEGRADVYPRLSPTMEWDTAAGHAVLAAAGGRVLTPNDAPLRYGKRSLNYRTDAFIAWGRKANTRRTFTPPH
jgi:3'(2'), 5'-bisphosphate nucleotidase